MRAEDIRARVVGDGCKNRSWVRVRIVGVRVRVVGVRFRVVGGVGLGLLGVGLGLDVLS